MTEQTLELKPWQLDDLFKNQNELKQTRDELEALVASLETKRETLTPEISEEEFLAFVRGLEEIQKLAYRMYGYVELSFAADTQDQKIQALHAETDQFLSELNNRVLFFDLWWKGLNDAAAERLMKNVGDYRYWLEEKRHFKPYTLSEPEEKIINIKNLTGVKALNMLYDSITNRYRFAMTIDGEKKMLSRGELMVYARSSEPALREAAYKELYRVYGDESPVLGQIYQTIVRDWRNENIKMRKYPAPISTRNLMNDIPDDVIKILLDVCRNNAPVFQRFFGIKAKLLGMKKLRRYDIYAPVSESEKKIGFDKAVEMVMESFHQFSPEFSKMAGRVFDDNHLDSEVRKGKLDGAFCATITPDLTPWVLVNYQSRLGDVTTLAHELGHAIHAMLAEQHNIFTQQASLPLAETASTFGEMMLVDRLLAEEQDPNARRDLLFRQVDDAYATIMRQAYFALFENQAHEMIAKGATIDALADAYQQNLEDQFGTALELSDEFRWEWVSIPHIYHVPFYVYAYAFGQLLVLSLYQQYKTEGESFKPRYLQILSAGGSASPAKILSDAGIDIADPSFWQGGFDVVAGMVEQLLALPA